MVSALSNHPSAQSEPVKAPGKPASIKTSKNVQAKDGTENNARVNKDGDTLDIRGRKDVEAEDRYSADGRLENQPEKADAAQEIDPETAAKERGVWEKIMQMKEELLKQQAILLESLTRDSKKPVEDGEGRIVFVEIVDESGETEAAENTAAVPEYWNAENTSNRIVGFATAFAELHGDNKAEFAEIIKQAVAEGFSQANAITGNLPGAAGKLYRDTQEMTLAKLDKWLEEWQATPYTESAQLSETA